MSEKPQTPVVETYRFADDGVVPNSRLSLVVYCGALVKLPEADPVTGRADPLLDCWRG